MATKPHGHDSHLICPTCESDVSGRKGLEYFACEPEAPLTNDNVYSRYEETETLLRCLGALPLGERGGPRVIAFARPSATSRVRWQPGLDLDQVVSPLLRLGDDVVGQRLQQPERLHRG